MTHPMMPFVPYAAKNCMASCPEANPDPINVAMTAPANLTTVTGRTAGAFCSDAIKTFLSLPEPLLLFALKILVQDTRPRERAIRHDEIPIALLPLARPVPCVSSRVAAITRYR